ncbi:Transcriptional regulator SUPERMAN -like protein [Gossypium arboreum]|uniref:Uncharacterized protein n=2 Tax=Gossypium arboreum TaxID=29729 RepID=A0ABR0QNJ8_GOSAR|nr:hypothetical protein PVK06_009802 [Gossypium arboreum]KHG23787.1 Transcriptional regulator SUPERMAN -like protein [Gossypium arboreum]
MATNQGFEEDYLSGFSWPPRSYTCSFCERGFRSAQALGGHMNVHRRDKARLRQLPPPMDHHVSSPLPCEMKKWLVNETVVDSTDSTSMKGAKPLSGVKEFKDYGCKNKFMKKKKNNVNLDLDLDLEIGVVSDSKEDLDLELRLGYS